MMPKARRNRTSLGVIAFLGASMFFLPNANAISAPVFVAPTPEPGASIVVPVGTTVQVDAKATDVDVPAEMLTMTVTHGVLSPAPRFYPVNSNPAFATLVWTPSTAGDFPITFNVSDGTTTPTSRTFTIQVRQAPVLTFPSPPGLDASGFLDTFVFDQNVVTAAATVSFTARGTDADFPAEVVTLSAAGLPSGAAFSTVAGNPATGTFTWTPPTLGQTVITITARDALGLTHVRTVTIHARKSPTLLKAKAWLTPGLTTPGVPPNCDPEAPMVEQCTPATPTPPAPTIQFSATLNVLTTDANGNPIPGKPIPGRTVRFFIQSTEVCPGVPTTVTDNAGVAKCTFPREGLSATARAVPFVQMILTGGYTASFAEDGAFFASWDRGGVITD